MSERLTISVAMGTYNGSAFLREQLESILTQTQLPDELVVCDDASTDGTLVILQEFRERAPFPVVIVEHPVTVGVCKNFEEAISRCAGDIIALSDQDDVWEPRKLEELLAKFAADPSCGYVFSNADLVDEEGRSQGRNLWQSIGFDQGKQQSYASEMQLELMLQSCNLVYGMSLAFRACYRQILLPIESRLHTACTHDTWISLMLSACGAYGSAIPELLVRYRQHGNQLAGGGRPSSFADKLVRDHRERDEIDLALADSLLNMAGRLKNAVRDSGSAELRRCMLIDKAAHLKARVAIRTASVLRRPVLALHEARTGRYGRFSSSVSSAVKDLISG